MCGSFLSCLSLRCGTAELLHPQLEWNLGSSLCVCVPFFVCLFLSFIDFIDFFFNLILKETHSLALQIPPTLQIITLGREGLLHASAVWSRSRAVMCVVRDPEEGCVTLQKDLGLSAVASFSSVNDNPKPRQAAGRESENH